MNMPSPLGVEAPEEFKHRTEMMKPLMKFAEIYHCIVALRTLV